jgi:hypothetical protein
MKRHATTALLLIVAISLAACAASRSEPAYEVERELSAPGVAVESFADAGAPLPESKAILTSEEMPAERLVIRNASLEIVVNDPAQSVDELSNMAEELGGFVVSSNVYQVTYDENILVNEASITIRVLAEHLDEALQRIKQDAIEVQSENITGQDVTQEYTDLQSQLRNLEAAEEELREIMSSASKAEDVLSVFEHLRQVREQIEVTKGRIQYFEESARLSAISIQLLPDVAAQPLQIGRWQPQGTAKAAVEALIHALQFLAEAAIWTLICVLPIGLILGLPAWFVIRTIRRRRKARASATEAEEA